jgi:hypothetical protein
MPDLDRITRSPQIMGGKPRLRGMRVTVGTIVGLAAAGPTLRGAPKGSKRPFQWHDLHSVFAIRELRMNSPARLPI